MLLMMHEPGTGVVMNRTAYINEDKLMIEVNSTELQNRTFNKIVCKLNDDIDDRHLKLDVIEVVKELLEHEGINAVFFYHSKETAAYWRKRFYKVDASLADKDSWFERLATFTKSPTEMRGKYVLCVGGLMFFPTSPGELGKLLYQDYDEDEEPSKKQQLVVDETERDVDTFWVYLTLESTDEYLDKVRERLRSKFQFVTFIFPTKPCCAEADFIKKQFPRMFLRNGSARPGVDLCKNWL